MNKFLILFILGVFFLGFKKINFIKTKNIKLNNFKIFLREEEKTSSNPYININIGNYDNEKNISRKSNIHRARLSKFKKSKLNGEMIFQDNEQRIYKLDKGKKIYL